MNTTDLHQSPVTRPAGLHPGKPIIRFLLLLLALIAAHTAGAADRYQVRFSDDLREVVVKACFDGDAPDRLYVDDDANRFVRWFRINTKRQRPNFRRSRLQLPRMAPNSCLSYAVDLKSASDENNWRLALLREKTLLASTPLWFWLPSRPRETVIDVELPDGFDISAPWQRISDNGTIRRYRPDKSPRSWGSKVAVGDIRVERISIPGSTLRVATVGSFSERQRRDAHFWVEEAARSVVQVHGSFPQPSPQILVVAIGRQREAVPWAQVTRGGGVAAHFYIDQTRDLSEFRDDWTPTHELSHMLIPYVSSRDRWLSEGLASYYQNTLRARDGRLPEDLAWQKLHDGFRRGVNGTRGQPLNRASRNMGANGGYMRVYWSGAAILLMADIHLRRATGGRQNLDTALAKLYDCCMQNTRTWRASTLLQKLDELTGTRVFSEVYRNEATSPEFPDIFAFYDELGLQTRRNRVAVVERTPWGRIRTNIMSN